MSCSKALSDLWCSEGFSQRVNRKREEDWTWSFKIRVCLRFFTEDVLTSCWSLELMGVSCLRNMNISFISLLKYIFFQAYCDYVGFILTLNESVKGKKLTCQFEVSQVKHFYLLWCYRSLFFSRGAQFLFLLLTLGGVMMMMMKSSGCFLTLQQFFFFFRRLRSCWIF